VAFLAVAGALAARVFLRGALVADEVVGMMASPLKINTVYTVKGFLY
jgi:hypothetical protein